MLQVENWNRSNFCWGMSRCRPQSATLAASRRSGAPSTTALASSRNNEVCGPQSKFLVRDITGLILTVACKPACYHVLAGRNGPQVTPTRFELLMAGDF